MLPLEGFSNTATQATLSIGDIYRLVRIEELGGGTFCGFQPGLKEYVILFTHPLSGSTLAVNISELTADNVRQKIFAAVQERFQLS